MMSDGVISKHFTPPSAAGIFLGPLINIANILLKHVYTLDGSTSSKTVVSS